MSDELNIKELRNVAEAFCAANLSACAAELCEWQNTGLLRDGKFRELGDLCEKYVGGHDGLRNAEHMVNYQACQLISRTAPSSPMGEELPALAEPDADLLGDGEYPVWNRAQVEQAQRAAREYQRKVDEKIIARRDERIRQLERELAERRTASIGDSVDFQALLTDVMVASKNGQGVTVVAEKVQALIAYIDGRTAGTVPEGWHEAMARLCEDRAMHWQQDECTYAAGKKAGALDCAEVIRTAAPTPMNSGKEEGK
jgi:hypothetical protein